MRRFHRTAAGTCPPPASLRPFCEEAVLLIRYSMRRGESPSLVAAAVVLFDIDGTLVRRAGPHHRQALEAAALRVTGQACSTDGIPVQGMLDGDILTAMLERAGLSAASIRRDLPAIMTEAQRIYLRTAPRDLHARVCPGAKALLRRLRRQGIPAGLVTGNLSRIAWRKMESAGLRSYLSFGAFAEMGEIGRAHV